MLHTEVKETRAALPPQDSLKAVRANPSPGACRNSAEASPRPPYPHGAGSTLLTQLQAQHCLLTRTDGYLCLGEGSFGWRPMPMVLTPPLGQEGNREPPGTELGSPKSHGHTGPWSPIGALWDTRAPAQTRGTLGLWALCSWPQKSQKSIFE